MQLSADHIGGLHGKGQGLVRGKGGHVGHLQLLDVYKRQIGNSVMPLVFLLLSSALNVVLDLWFIAGMGMGAVSYTHLDVYKRQALQCWIAGQTSCLQVRTGKTAEHYTKS